MRIRMFDTIGAGLGERLRGEHKREIRRAAQLADVPRATPGEAARSFAAAAEADPGFRQWKQQREPRAS